MKHFDLASKNAALAVLLVMWLLFFGAAIGFSLHPGTKDLAADMWKLFAGANIGVVALLNSNAKGSADSDKSDPTQPGA